MIRKILLLLSMFLTGCLLLLIILNLFDAPETKVLFTEKDLNRVSSTGPDNGFYWLLSLNEPLGVDATSREIIATYTATLGEGNAGFKAQKEIAKRIRENARNWNFGSAHFRAEDPFEAVKAHMNQIQADAQGFKPMLERFENAINTPGVDDFSPP